MNYAQHFQTKQTFQSEPIPGTLQVPNSAGGYAFPVDDWKKLDRFLVLGSEGGSYYASEHKLTVDNAEATLRCLIADGRRVVNRVVEISEAGRAPKNDQAIFVLAIAAGTKDINTRLAALEALPRVCRTSTHLFQFVEEVKGFRGWGRMLRTAVGSWYTEKDVDKLAYQLVKYQQRGGWSHRDLLRLSHPSCHWDNKMRPLIRWAVGKPSEGLLPALVEGFIKIQQAETPKDVVRVLLDHPSLPWETIPTTHLGSPEVWEALLPNLPLTALLRSLARMTANGLLQPFSNAVGVVKSKILNETALKQSRIHPISVLTAMLTYSSGMGLKGNLKWSPVRAVVDALDEAFYLSFGNVEPTRKRLLLALDVSGSMDEGVVAGVNGLTPRIASAALAMVTARCEKEWAAVAFTSAVARSNRLIGGQWGGESALTPLTISPRQRLDDICRLTASLQMGGTDCALPMVWALEQKIKVDAFLIYTDSETWAGAVHPSQALRRYRDVMGIPAKLVVVGMVSNGFSIADPLDGGMMDVVGFDMATPNLISDFCEG